MASSSFTNAYLVDFDSILEIPDNEGMQKMFKALETNGLRGFMGCKPVLYQSELGQFFDTALVQDEDITGAISGKYFTVTPSRFLGVFEFPTEGISNFSDVTKNQVMDARRIFSKSGEHVDTHGKKKFLKYEYRLLNDILAKSIRVKAGSFDAVTNERFQIMTAIHFGLKINWGKVLFSVLKEIVDRTVKKAKGFGAQISVLLNSDPVLSMGNATSFPSSKILSPKVVLAYISSHEAADARGQSEEGGKSPVAVVKRASKSKKKSESSRDAPVEIVSEIIGSKKRPASASDEPAITKRKRTSKGKPSYSQSSTVSIAQGEVPLQVIEPTPAETVKQPPVSQRQTRRRRVILSTVSEDEDEEDTENVINVSHVSRQVEPPIDDVDVIIRQVISQTTGLTADELEQEGQRIDEPEIGDDVDQWFEGSFQDFDSRVDEQMVGSTSGLDQGTETVGTADTAKLSEIENIEKADGSNSMDVGESSEQAAGSKKRVEELMYIDDLLLQISDDMMLPSITAAEISKSGLKQLQAVFVYKRQVPRTVVEEDIVQNGYFIEAVQYWDVAPSLTKTWAWQRVCTEVILFSVSGCLRPASCFTDIVVANLGVERLPDYFLDDFDQGIHTEYFIDCLSDSSVQSDSESTSGNTVYRSPYPADNSFALGRVTFTSAQEELLYSVEFPDSPPPTSQRQESTSSASGSPLSITPDDVPLKDHTEDNETSLPTTSTDLSSAVDDIKSFLAQSIADSENNILHKIQVVINGLRDNQYQQQDFFRTQFHNSRQAIHNYVNTMSVHISEYRKGVQNFGASVNTNNLAIQRKIDAQQAKIDDLDTQVAAIRNDQLEFQTRIAADILSLSTQISDIADFHKEW
ncbi:hypothetical protein F511_43430 [Dorcoceras hygrometricum]|uniref:Dystroglycan-like n=1 Tax=Dorcoceras hygrometricum TaxID=472368 RepID=A0A2Z7CSJ5_9LAMI|nr:hypothetical protein F511_43430 [Dorcoceras hygrometricum]